MAAWFEIIGLGIIAAIAYGIASDKITASICVKYFTVGRDQIYGS